MPIQPLYYTESQGPQFAQEVMYKAPYEYLEKGEMMKAQTSATLKQTANLLDSVLNIQVLDSNQEALQTSNKAYREKIDALTNEISSGNITSQTMRNIGEIGRELSQDMLYGNRRLWTTQLNTRNAFMTNNIELSKTNPELYSKAVDQFTNKVLSANKPDDLVKLSTMLLSGSPTFGLEDSANLVRFNELLRRTTTGFYGTDKTVTEADKKEFLQMITKSRPDEVKSFIENYMKSTPGYEAHLASLEFGESGDMNASRYEDKSIWDPTHPYYNKAMAMKTALTSYSQQLSINPAYVNRLKAEQEASNSGTYPNGAPKLTPQVKNVSKSSINITPLTTKGTVVNLNSNIAATARQAAKAYLGNNSVSNSPYKIQSTNLWASKLAPAPPTRAEYIQGFINSAPNDWKYVQESQFGGSSGMASITNYDRSPKKPLTLALTEKMAKLAGEAFMKTRLVYTKNTKLNTVNGLEERTWNDMAEYVYSNMAEDLRKNYNLDKKQALANIKMTIKGGLYGATTALVNARNKIDISATEYAVFPTNTKSTAKSKTGEAENQVLATKFTNEASDFSVILDDTNPESSYKQASMDLSELLKTNKIVSVEGRNAPCMFGPVSYAILYTPIGAKKGTEPQEAIVVLNNPMTSRGQTKFTELAKITLDYGSAGFMEERDEHGDVTTTFNPATTHFAYANFASLVHNVALQTYIPDQYSITLSPQTWTNVFGAPPGVANYLYNNPIIWDKATNEILLPNVPNGHYAVTDFLDNLDKFATN